MTDETHPPRDSFAETVLANCTTSLPFKFEFDPKDNGHTLFVGTTRQGMSGMPMLARDVLLALDSLKTKAETTGISLRELSQQVGLESTLRSDKMLRKAIESLTAQHVIPGLRYGEEDGLVRIGNDAR